MHWLISATSFIEQEIPLLLTHISSLSDILVLSYSSL